MKRMILGLLVLTMFLPAKAQESGIRFFKGTLEEAMKTARKENKKIFIDFFTEWCGPCLNMATKVFTQPQVGDVYNRNFVCMKIDAEKGEGRLLAQKFGIQSYPTYIFLDPRSGELIHRSGSNKPAGYFIEDAQGALNPKLSSLYLDKVYKSGKYDKEFLMTYIHCKKAAGSRKLENAFAQLLSKGGKLTDPEVWKLYKECIDGYKNPYIQEISSNYGKFVKCFGKEEVDGKLAAATRFASKEVLEGLCDFEGKYFNMKTMEMAGFFRTGRNREGWAMAGELIRDPKIDQKELARYLSFYVRVNEKRGDNELSFEDLVTKVRLNQYVAYNNFDREDASVHYNYAVALQYLIKRSLEEGKKIPAELFKPAYGKQEYTLRNPLLKQKPARKVKRRR